MYKIKCVAIDDEPLALNLVESFIEKTPYLSLIRGCESAYEAIDILKTHNIELLFLDINMPDIAGIDFFKTLSTPPCVIFTTAYDKYAVESYELNAVDYLLKPFSFERFLKATDKVYEKIHTSSHDQAKINGEFIFVKSEHNIIKIPLDDIQYIEGFKDYLKIYTNEKKPIFTLKSMIAIEEILPKNRFVRVHRSFIISIDKIHSFRNGKIKIMNRSIPIGESYKDTFVERVVDGRI